MDPFGPASHSWICICVISGIPSTVAICTHLISGPFGPLDPLTNPGSSRWTPDPDPEMTDSHDLYGCNIWHSFYRGYMHTPNTSMHSTYPASRTLATTNPGSRPAMGAPPKWTPFWTLFFTTVQQVYGGVALVFTTRNNVKRIHI